MRTLSRTIRNVLKPGTILSLSIVLTLFAPLLFGAQVTVFAEPSVTVQPKLGPMKGGDNADDPAIWIHPSDPSRSLMFLSDKDAGIYVFDFKGNQIQQINFNTRLNNIDVRYDFKFGNETIDIVAGNLREVGKLAVLKINQNYSSGDAVSVLAGPNSSGNDIQENSYGFTLYQRPSDGAIFAFDKPKGGTSIKQFLISGSGGQIQLTQVREIKDVSIDVAEGLVADDELGFVYFAEESKGVHKYNADPGSGNLNRLSFFASSDGISGDREGFALYKCNDGSGYLVLSSQGNSTFKVYERQGNNTFVKTFSAAQSDGTDGLDVSSAAAPNFPNGFAVIHDDPGAQYYVYDWGDIAESDLEVCPNGGPGGPTPTPPTPTPPTPTPTPPKQSFVDVSPSHWAFSYIEALYQDGYISGCSADPLMYCPDNTMTRAESAVFIERGVHGAGYTPAQPAQATFADVPLWEWFAKWADGLWDDGYTAGCGTNPLIYCPLQQHSMAEGAVFYLRMLNGSTYEPPSSTGIFSDVPTSAWYARWVEAAYAAGIFPACQTEPELRACPMAPLTRAMGAFMMVQAKGISIQ